MRLVMGFTVGLGRDVGLVYKVCRQKCKVLWLVPLNPPAYTHLYEFFNPSIKQLKTMKYIYNNRNIPPPLSCVTFFGEPMNSRRRI